jgi:hypothetical protein
MSVRSMLPLKGQLARHRRDRADRRCCAPAPLVCGFRLSCWLAAEPPKEPLRDGSHRFPFARRTEAIAAGGSEADSPSSSIGIPPSPVLCHSHLFPPTVRSSQAQ